MDTRQGTLYYQYKSEGDTGKGVGTGEQYYADPSLGQMSLSELYFVPKPDFSGTAVIHYTGYASGSSFFQGTIEVTVEEQEDVSYSVAGQQPLSLNADDFNRICRSHTGRELSYVIFSQPDSGRGHCITTISPSRITAARWTPPSSISAAEAPTCPTSPLWLPQATGERW